MSLHENHIMDFVILINFLVLPPPQSLGTAPKWCSHLDALIEELEEEEAPAQFDDYKFVTEDELKQLGLHDLIGGCQLSTSLFFFGGGAAKCEKNILMIILKLWRD